MNEPQRYIEWLDLFSAKSCCFCLFRDMLRDTNDLRIFLRHDIDVLDEKLISKCIDLETKEEVKSTWFFLPPKDIRYNGKINYLSKLIKEVDSAGLEVGYHINVWEKPGTKAITDRPIEQLSDDLKWFEDQLGKKIRSAVAHGIPHHSEHVSNLSMFDTLSNYGVNQYDPFIIRDGGEGRKSHHFKNRTVNPLLTKNELIIYISDSGGPIKKVWNDLDLLVQSGNIVVFNTHCGNYDIDRVLKYIPSVLKPGAMPVDCELRILI